MSDTPRTDAAEAEQRAYWNRTTECGWPAFPSDFDFARQLERELSALRAELESVTFQRDEWKMHSELAVNEMNVQFERAEKAEAELSAARKDAERYRWLTADHDDRAVRRKKNEIADRIAVMSYSASNSDIDAAIDKETSK